MVSLTSLKSKVSKTVKDVKTTVSNTSQKVSATVKARSASIKDTVVRTAPAVKGTVQQAVGKVATTAKAGIVSTSKKVTTAVKPSVKTSKEAAATPSRAPVTSTILPKLDLPVLSFPKLSTPTIGSGAKVMSAAADILSPSKVVDMVTSPVPSLLGAATAITDIWGSIMPNVEDTVSGLIGSTPNVATEVDKERISNPIVLGGGGGYDNTPFIIRDNSGGLRETGSNSGTGGNVLIIAATVVIGYLLATGKV